MIEETVIDELQKKYNKVLHQRDILLIRTREAAQYARFPENAIAKAVLDEIGEKF